MVENKIQLRVCKVCHVEKPITEFRPLHHGYYRMFCKICYNAKRRRLAHIKTAANKQLYGTANTPEQLAQSRAYKAVWRDKKRELYGIVTSPEQEAAILLHVKQRLAEMRLRAIALYGGKCECCGETNPKLLTFNHINGNTKKERATTGARAYIKLMKLGYPNDTYRLLCYNCNLASSFYGYCPHKGTPVQDNKTAIINRKVKSEMITAYGGKCQLCGETQLEFMTIDHINGDGNQDRADLRVPRGGVRLYSKLKNMGWPKDRYRLLCLNCNCNDKVRRKTDAR